MRKDKAKDVLNSADATPNVGILPARPDALTIRDPERRVAQRKIRSREHVLADLAVNFVERQAILCTFSVERVLRDYGIDLVMYTFNDQGEIESGQILFQVKGTEHVRSVKGGEYLSFALNKRDTCGSLSLIRSSWLFTMG
jgi:hypothetical protein